MYHEGLRGPEPKSKQQHLLGGEAMSLTTLSPKYQRDGWKPPWGKRHTFTSVTEHKNEGAAGDGGVSVPH